VGYGENDDPNQEKRVLGQGRKEEEGILARGGNESKGGNPGLGVLRKAYQRGPAQTAVKSGLGRPGTVKGILERKRDSATGTAGDEEKP